MRILQICNKTPYPIKDGGALAIHNLIKGFSEAGHNVQVLAFNTSKHPVENNAVLEYFSKMNVHIDLVDLNLKISPVIALINLIFSRIPYNISRFINTTFNEKLKNILLASPFDIVQLEGAYLIPYITTIRSNSKAKIVFRAHNIEHEIWFRYADNEKNPLKKLYIKSLAKRLKNYESNSLNQFDLLVPITLRDNDSFRKMGNNCPIHVCPYSFDFKEFENIKNEFNANHLFFIGSIDWLPNQEAVRWFLDEIWEDILSKNPQAVFYIAGRNAPVKFIKYLNRKNVRYSGEVDNANEFMKDKTILIAPLFAGSGMRVKIIEAMAFGKTVITTSIGAEGIEALNEVHLLIADNSSDFKKYLNKSISDENYCMQIGKNAAKFVKDHFDNRKIISELINFYKDHCNVS